MSSKLITEGFEKAVERIVEAPFDEIVVLHLRYTSDKLPIWNFFIFNFQIDFRCLSCINQQKYLEAYTEQSALVQAFTKIFQTQKEDNWALFIMYVISLDLRMFAIKSDKELAQRGTDKPGQTLEKAAECLMGLFRVCTADK